MEIACLQAEPLAFAIVHGVSIVASSNGWRRKAAEAFGLLDRIAEANFHIGRDRDALGCDPSDRGASIRLRWWIGERRAAWGSADRDRFSEEAA